MISPRLFDVVRCPECGASLPVSSAPRFACPSCRREFDASQGYLDLRPATAFAEQTKYLDDALHTDARHESVAPPLLGSRIRHNMLRRFLALSPGDRALDLGCGSGRTLVWSKDTGAGMTGIDISPFFAREALDDCDLLLGDLRRLPLADDAFGKAWSLDVLEHLSPAALNDMLREAHRVLAPGGALFVYTHVRKNGWAAGGVRLVNRLAAMCERLGLIDLRQERLRKSDHLNPITDHAHLRAIVADAGFELERITYYTPVIGAFVENVLVRMAERWLTRRAAKRSATTDAATASKAARAAAKSRVRQGGPTYLVLRALTALMSLDVVIFGRVQSGPFFALLRKSPGPRPEA
jgi:SAM-dependent methyltransferase